MNVSSVDSRRILEPRMRSLLPAALCLLVLAGCPSSNTGTTDAGAPTPSASASSVPSASPPSPKEFASVGPITLQLQKHVAMEFIAHGSWVAYAPKGETAIVGAPGRASFFPGDKPLPNPEPTNASYTHDGKRFFLIHSSQSALTNEVTVHATSDQHLIAKVQNAFDPQWFDDDLVFHRDGQVFRLKGAETKLIGPTKAAFSGRAKAVVVAPNLESMIVVDQLEQHITGVRRVALTASGSDKLLIGADVIGKLTKSNAPVAVIAPDASRACVVGTIRSETTIWCASDDTAAEQIVSFVDTSRSAHWAAFVGPDLLGYRSTVAGSLGTADFKKRTVAALPIPGATTSTDLTALPGGKLAVARDFYRVGIVDFENKKFTPIGDDKATPKSLAGVGTDDTVFAVAGSSLDAGLGVYKVTVPK